MPDDIEYDELPRGRVACDVVTERYTILADQCTPADKALVASRIRLVCLYPRAILGTVEHVVGGVLDEEDIPNCSGKMSKKYFQPFSCPLPASVSGSRYAGMQESHHGVISLFLEGDSHC